MKGFLVSKNPLGFTTVRLHYSAAPDKDVTHPDPEKAAAANEWLQQAQRGYADPNRWNQEMEINWWVSIGARVFPEFTEAHHAPFPLAPHPRRIMYRAWDFGWHAPVCLVASIDGADRLLVLREIVGREQSTRSFAIDVLDELASQYGLWGPGYQDFCDPAGQQVTSAENEKSEKRDVEVLNGLGIFPSWEHGWSRKDGRALVHQLLVLRTDGTPGILVDPAGCPTLVQAFLGKYVYPERQDGRVADEPEDRGNHPWADVMASMRYLCTGLYQQLGLRRFRYQPIIPPKPQTFHGYGTPALSKYERRRR